MPEIWYTKTSSCSQPVGREHQVIGRQRGKAYMKSNDNNNQKQKKKQATVKQPWHQKLVKICGPAISLLIEQLHK